MRWIELPACVEDAIYMDMWSDDGDSDAKDISEVEGDALTQWAARN